MNEIYFSFEDDDPGNLVEALNTDRSLIIWGQDDLSGRDIMIKIDYNGIHIKQVL